MRRLWNNGGDSWLCLWPGLAALWIGGSWRGLAVAVAFSALVNGLLAVTLVWHELATAGVKWAGWSAAFGTWFVLTLVAYRKLPKRQESSACVESDDNLDSSKGREDLYPSAVSEYLKRNYVEAQRLLAQLIEKDARDVPAGLLLATVYRRGGEANEARQELTRLTRLEAAEPWHREIEEELKALEDAKKSESEAQAA